MRVRRFPEQVECGGCGWCDDAQFEDGTYLESDHESEEGW